MSFFCFHVTFIYLTAVFLCALANLPENKLDVFEMACLMEFYFFCPFSWCLFHNLYFYVRRITKGLVPLVKDHALLEHQLLLVLENQYNVLCSKAFDINYYPSFLHISYEPIFWLWLWLTPILVLHDFFEALLYYFEGRQLMQIP